MRVLIFRTEVGVLSRESLNIMYGPRGFAGEENAPRAWWCIQRPVKASFLVQIDFFMRVGIFYVRYNDIKAGLEKVLVSCGAVTDSFLGEAGAFGGEASPSASPTG